MSKRQLLSFLCALAVATPALAHPGGLNTPSPDIPPIIVPGVYLSPQDVHAKYSGPGLEIVLSMVEHQPFALLDPTLFECGQPGGSACREHHHFDSDLTVDVSINGSIPQEMQMQGDVRTVAFGKGPGNPTGTFDTEMLQMNLMGTFMGNPVMIRESPTKASTGKTSITDVGPAGPPDGPYHIDSFFDVFTELSLDGGQTWIPKSGLRGTHVVLGGVPEPASVMILAIGLIGIAGLSRGRR